MRKSNLIYFALTVTALIGAVAMMALYKPKPPKRKQKIPEPTRDITQEDLEKLREKFNNKAGQ